MFQIDSILKISLAKTLLKAHAVCIFMFGVLNGGSKLPLFPVLSL